MNDTSTYDKNELNSVGSLRWLEPDNNIEAVYRRKSFYSGTDDDALIRKMVERSLNDEIEILISIGKREIFEDGMESDFSRHLQLLLARYDELGIQNLQEKISENELPPTIAGETLKLLAEYSETVTKNWVYKLIISSLHSTYVEVRDGATNAIASLDDPKAITALQSAIEREQNLELRQDMETVLEQLIATREEQ